MTPGSLPPHAGLVSVVVPAFNAERWLGETIASILAQDHRALEVIVVDDGSTDATAAVAAQHAERDARVRIVRQPNRGLGAARNCGLAHAQGEYVAFLDADDLWSTEKLRLQLERLGTERGRAVLCGIQRFMDTDGGRHWLHRTEALDFERGAAGLGRVLRLHSQQMALFTTALFRTHELAELGGWGLRLTSAEDWELGLRAVRTLSFVSVPQALYLYRKHGASLTAQAGLEDVLRLHLWLLRREESGGDVPRGAIGAARRAKLLEFARAALWQGQARLAVRWLAVGWLRHGGALDRAYYEASLRLAARQAGRWFKRRRAC